MAQRCRGAVAQMLGLALLLASAVAATAADPWSVLGLSRGEASEADVKRAYRALALELHPDKNPDPAAAQRWLEVQAAHAELTERGAGDPFTRRYREQQRARAEAAAAWRAFWGGARRPPPRIPSSTPSLDASSFSQRVLSAAGRGPGAPPWLIQVFAADSPYCRALSGEWEAAAAEAGGLLHMGRVDFHEQPMLVRFLASRLRGLFLGVQPWRELPVAFGLPRGCLSMACAVPFSGHFTAERLQRFAAARLLRLPALPPLTSRLLGSWCHAVPAGRVGVLALLRPGHTPPTALLDAVQKGRGLLHAAAAEWRPADRAVWADHAGVAAPPALIFCTAGGLVSVPASQLSSGVSWAAEVQRHAGTGAGARRASLPAAALSSLLLACIHALARVELMWRRLAAGAGALLGMAGVRWQQAAAALTAAAALYGFKRLLDFLSAVDEEYEGSSPEKSGSHRRRSAAAGSPAGSRVREMRQADWEPTPGRFQVLLPLPAGRGEEQQHVAAQHRRRLESLAAVFQRERRLAFRVVPVSDAFARLLPSGQQQQQQQGAIAYVLHPRRGRVQQLPLADMQSAVLRLEAVLDGGGEWRHL